MNSTLFLIEGKAHRLCDCDTMSSACRAGRKRHLQTCGFSQCLIPVPDAIYAATPPALPDEAAEVVRRLRERARELAGSTLITGQDDARMLFGAASLIERLAPRSQGECCCANHIPHGRCLQCPVHGTNPPQKGST